MPIKSYINPKNTVIGNHSLFDKSIETVLIFQIKHSTMCTSRIIIGLCLMFLTVAFTTGLGNETPESRIVGGLEARQGQFRYIASLQTVQFGHFCGSTIISYHWVISAASCVSEKRAGSFFIRTGSHLTNYGGAKYETDAVIIHHRFDYNIRANDIALIRSSTAITLNAKTAFATIPSTFVGMESFATVAGWGYTRVNGQISNNLQYFQTPIISNERCKSLLSSSNYSQLVQLTNVCALSKKGQGICRGDSGSPLAIGNQLVGIVSFGVPCGTGVPDVYTRVSQYISWIQTTQLQYS